jgi:hypothetical protein
VASGIGALAVDELLQIAVRVAYGQHLCMCCVVFVHGGVAFVCCVCVHPREMPDPGRVRKKTHVCKDEGSGVAQRSAVVAS